MSKTRKSAILTFALILLTMMYFLLYLRRTTDYHNLLGHLISLLIVSISSLCASMIVNQKIGRVIYGKLPKTEPKRNWGPFINSLEWKTSSPKQRVFLLSYLSMTISNGIFCGCGFSAIALEYMGH